MLKNLFTNPTTLKDSDHLSVWIFLLLNTHTHTKEISLYNQKILLQPGQLLITRKELAKKLKICETKIFRILKVLESEQLIEQQTTPRYTLLSIKNWQCYFKSEQQNEQQKLVKDTEIISENVKFRKPTLQEVQEYCQERKNNIDPQKFLDYYESVGWKIGKKPMKDWKACVRTWERKQLPPKKFTNQNLKPYENIF
jgi:DNA-binding transcriptional regulator YhcF (GntR family)